MGVNATPQKPGAYGTDPRLQALTAMAATQGRGAPGGVAQLTAALLANQRQKQLGQFGNQQAGYQPAGPGALPAAVAPLTAQPGVQVRGMPVAPGMPAPNPQAIPQQ